MQAAGRVFTQSEIHEGARAGRNYRSHVDVRRRLAAQTTYSPTRPAGSEVTDFGSRNADLNNAPSIHIP